MSADSDQPKNTAVPELPFIWALLLGVLAWVAATAALGGVRALNYIPSHSDDFVVLASTFDWTLLRSVRPVSSLLISGLSDLGAVTVSWTLRLMTIAYIVVAARLVGSLVGVRLGAFGVIFVVGLVGVSATATYYGHYLAVYTHLTSGLLGALGMTVVWRARDTSSRGLRAAALALLVLSGFAKEDLLLPNLGLIAFATCWRDGDLRWPRSVELAWLATSVVVAVGILAWGRFGTQSPFLGTSDPSHPYYLVISPASVITTSWKYLSGAAHYTTQSHGLGLLVLSLVGAGLLVWRRGLAAGVPAAFVLVVIVALSLPYAVLPNHIDPIYAILWLPFMAGLFACGLMQAGGDARSPSRVAIWIGAAVLAAAVFVSVPGRRATQEYLFGHAAYSERVVSELKRLAPDLQPLGKVAVIGASWFTPWFKSDLLYLKRRMSLDLDWVMYVDPADQFYSAWEVGEQFSGGHVQIVPLEPGVVPEVPHLLVGPEGDIEMVGFSR